LLDGASDVQFADGLQAQRLGHLPHHLLRARPVAVPVVVDERLALVVDVQQVPAFVDYRDVLGLLSHGYDGGAGERQSHQPLVFALLAISSPKPGQNDLQNDEFARKAKGSD
jgi:hypothetical protein